MAGSPEHEDRDTIGRNRGRNNAIYYYKQCFDGKGGIMKHFIRFGGQGSPTEDVQPQDLCPMTAWFYISLVLAAVAIIGGAIIAEIF